MIPGEGQLFPTPPHNKAEEDMTDPLPAFINFSPKVIFEPVHEEAVLLDLDTRESFALNTIGMRMWQLQSNNPSTEGAIQQLLQEYQVEEATLRQDMAAWINHLRARGLAIASP